MEFVLPLPECNDETSASYHSWKSLKQRFKGFCAMQHRKHASGEDSMSVPMSSLLMHVGGRYLQELLETCSALRDLSQNDLMDLFENIENKCLPGFILTYERFRFFSMKQKMSEDFQEFISELRMRGEYCELQDHKEKYIIGRIISGVCSDHLRKQLQSIENLDLKKIIETCSNAADDGPAKGVEHSTNKKQSHKQRGKTKARCHIDQVKEMRLAVNENTVPKRQMTRAKRGKVEGEQESRSSLKTNERTTKDHEQDSADDSLALPGLKRSLRKTRNNTHSDLNQDMSRISITTRLKVHGKSVPIHRKFPSKVSASQNFEIPSEMDSIRDVSEQDESHTDLNLVTPTLVRCADEQKDSVTLCYVPEEDVKAEISSVDVAARSRSPVNTEVRTSGLQFDYIDEKDIKVDEEDDKNVETEDDIEGKADKSEQKKFKKKCPICGSLFSTAYMLKCHTRIHSGQRLYKCEICDMSFIHSGSRSRHLRQSHPELLKFQCEECDMLFELQTALDQHKLSHSKKQEIACEDCGETFMSTREHYQHRRKEHRNIRYNCDICGLHFPYPSKLKLHLMSKHNATKPYMCEICGSSFAERNMLANHKNTHSGEKKHECKTCGRRFLLKTTLNNHIQTHLDRKPHTCDICGMSFKLSYYLKSHMKTHAVQRERPHICSTCGAAFLKSAQLRNHERRHTGEKPYKCEVCNTVFSQISSMKKHMKQIHEGIKPKDRFSCEYCGLSFTHSCKLKLHIMKHTGERPFVCKICGSTYRENHQLTSHMKIHNGEEPFSCNICGRRFLQKAYLEGHVRKHTGEKPFKCPICDAGFTQKGYLRDHIKVHDENRERKYKCGVCGKAFTCSSHMRSHERLHSGEKPHKCDICGSRFTKRSSVKKHLRRTHGIHNPSSHQIQDSGVQSLQEPTVVPIAQLQSVDVSQAVLQSELQTDLSQNLQTQAHIQAQTHPDLHAELHTNLATQMQTEIHPEMSTQMSSDLQNMQVHSELHSDLQPQLHPEMNASLHTVHTSIQQVHQHPGIRIMHPDMHAGLHQVVHTPIQSQMHPVMSTDIGTQMHHSEMVQEMHIYTMAS